MNEYYTGYLESLKALNKSFVQTTDTVNEQSVLKMFPPTISENGSTMDEYHLRPLFESCPSTRK